MLSVLLIAMAASSAAWHWIAVSNTAISITGDVTFAASHLAFQNGQAIGLQYVGLRPVTAAQQKSIGDAAHYRLYKITTRTNPTLLNGNKLCGTSPTFLTVAYEPVAGLPKTTVLAAFYTGANPPPQWQESKTLCATYTYALK